MFDEREIKRMAKSKAIDLELIPEAYRPTQPLNSEASSKERNRIYPPAPQALPVPVIDNHTHMDFEKSSPIDVEQALGAAARVGVSGVVQVGCDVLSSRQAVQLAETHPQVLAAVAIHPNDAARLAERGELEAALDDIAALAGHERVRAIGETGLDYFRTEEPGRPAQEYSFRAHLELAREHHKAVQIHDRDAHQDVVRVLLDAQRPEKVVFHCFSGDEELARLCNEHGWYMSFAGTVSFKNSTDLQAALRVADPSLILVETDAPFLTPHPFRGRPNASYMIPYTVEFMARERGMDLAELCHLVAQNTRAVYGDF